MFKSLQNNEDGIVFVTVLTIIIAMMIMATAVINIQLNQTLVSEREIKRIKTEMLATGGLYRFLGTQFNNSLITDIILSESSGNMDYNFIISQNTSGSGPNSTDILTVIVEY